jgi:hypothetical protein
MRLNKIFMFTFLMGLSQVLPVSAQAVQLLDDLGSVGKYSSLAAGPYDYFISYYDQTNGSLKLAEANDIEGAPWFTQTVDSVGNVGRYSSIAYVPGSSGPHISYYDLTNGNLKYATLIGFGGNCGNASRYRCETVDSSQHDVGLYTSIAVGSNGVPYISYYDATSGNLKYAKKVAGTWVIVTLDSVGDVGLYSSIALDSNNRPEISYFDRTNGDLRYAKQNSDGTWSKYVIDSVGTVGLHTSLKVDSSDYAHISYYDETNFRVKYAKQVPLVPTPISTTFSDASVDSQSTAISISSEESSAIVPPPPAIFWKFEVVARATSSTAFAQTSLALDSNNNPHISFFQAQNTSMIYAKKLGASNWSFLSLTAPAGSRLYYNSLALNSLGVHVSFYDTVSSSLRLAYF